MSSNGRPQTEHRHRHEMVTITTLNWSAVLQSGRHGAGDSRRELRSSNGSQPETGVGINLFKYLKVEGAHFN